MPFEPRLRVLPASMFQVFRFEIAFAFVTYSVGFATRIVDSPLYLYEFLRGLAMCRRDLSRGLMRVVGAFAHLRSSQRSAFRVSDVACIAATITLEGLCEGDYQGKPNERRESNPRHLLGRQRS